VKHHIIEFKENLRTLLIGFLFVVLAARLTLSDLTVIGPASVAFLLVLVFVARPLSVWLSTIGSELDGRERAFLSSMAPRGIVAAAISSVFALQLAEQNVPGAERLVPITFLVIVGTVGLYGILAGPIGRRLGVAEPNPQGLIVVGAHRWARDLGARLQETGLRVLMLDTNRRNLKAARRRGLGIHRGNSLDQTMLEQVDFAGIGHLAALTPNDEVNSLTVIHFQEVLERAHTYQLPPAATGEEVDVARNLRGRVLFDESLSHEHLRSRFQEGWRSRIHEVEDPDADEDLGDYVNGPYPLFRVSDDGTLDPYTVDDRPSPEEGDRVILFGPPEDQ
jgi:hypothetical protein